MCCVVAILLGPVKRQYKSGIRGTKTAIPFITGSYLIHTLWAFASLLDRQGEHKEDELIPLMIEPGPDS